MRASMLGGIAASAILAAFSSPSSAASPQEDLVRAWLEGSSFGLAVDIGSSRFDPASQSVVLDGVTIGGPDDVLTAGFATLTVEDPRRTPDGMFAAHSIRGSAMDWVVRVDPERWFPELVEAIEDDQDPSDEALDGGDETPEGEDGAADGDADDGGVTVQTTVSPPFTAQFRADTIVYERAVLPMTAPTFADDASIVARYFEIVRWYMPTRVDWVELNGVELATAGLPDGNSATTYGRVYAAGIHDGRVERSGADDIRQSTAMEGFEQTVTAGSAYANGMDFGAMIEVLDPAAYRDGVGDGRWRPVLLRAGYTDMAVTFPEGSVTIGAIEADGVRMRQTEKPVVQLYEQILANPDTIEENPMAFAEEFLPSIFGFYGLNAMRMHDLEVNAPDGVRVRLGEMSLDDVDSDGIGAFTLSDIAVEAGEVGSGSLDLVTLNNVKFGSMLAWVKLGESTSTGDDATPGEMLEVLKTGWPAYDYFEVSGLAIDTPMGAIGLDSYATTNSDFLQQLPTRYDVSVTGFSMPLTLITDPTARVQLEQMGYETLGLSGAASVDYDVDAGEVHFLDVTLQATDMGTLSGDLHIGNIPLSILDEPDLIEARMLEATLVGGSLTFGNQSIVERIFDVQAKPLNQDPVQFRKNFGAGMPLMLGFLGDQELQSRFASAFKEFFEDPQSLRFWIEPAAPLPISALDSLQGSDPSEALKLLNLQAEANR